MARDEKGSSPVYNVSLWTYGGQETEGTNWLIVLTRGSGRALQK